MHSLLTFTHYNTDFTNDIFHMADLGFTELSMEPVVCDPSDPSALTEADLPILKEQYEILAKEMIKRNREGRGFTFYHYMIDLTVFIVSQRAASLQHADQIIVLDDGRMVGLGRHADLLKTCPVYEEIYASQFKKGDAQK